MNKRSLLFALGLAAVVFFFGAGVAIFDLYVAIAVIILLMIALTLMDFRIGVLVLIILTPFQKTMWLPSFTGFNLINYFTLATLGALALKQLNNKVPLPQFPRYLIWFYALPILLATAYGAIHLGRVPYFFLSMAENYESTRRYIMDFGVRPLLTILMIWMLGAAVRNSKVPERFLVPIMISLVLPAIPALGFIAWSGFDLSFLSSSSIGARTALNRVGLHANTLGPMLATALIVQLYVFAGASRLRARAALVIGMLLVSVTLLLTFSRGGYLVAAIGIVAFAVEQKKLRYLIYLAAGLLIVAAPFGGAIIERLTTGLAGSGPVSFSTTQPDALTAGRVMIWQSLLPDVLKSPLWGSGVGSIAWSGAVASGTVVVTHPHNLYLRILMDMGIVGLGAMLYVYWRMYGQYRTWSQQPNTSLVMTNAFKGAKAALVGLLVNGLTNGNYIYDEQQYCVWLVFGLGLALIRTPAANNPKAASAETPNASTPAFRKYNPPIPRQ